MNTTRRQACLVAVVCGLLSSCAPAPAPGTKATPATPLPGTPSATAAVGGADASNSADEVTLSAAASTKEAVEALVDKFTGETGIKVQVNLGPSSGLASQVLAGAPVDLFLSANQEWADKVAEGQPAARQQRLLTNRLVLVVPRGNPADVHGPEDLRSASVKKIALAGEKVPAGRYADQALTKLGLLESLAAAGKIARGQDVRSALTYVERGEAEAGIVYSTDVFVSSEIETVHEFDPALHDEIVYVLVLLAQGVQNPAAEKLFEFLQSANANDVYSKFGFSRLDRDRSP